MATSKMMDDKAHASKMKPGIKDVEIKHNLDRECDEFSCNARAIGVCKDCGKSFCNYHLSPRMVTTASYIQMMDKSDFEKWKKYYDDWRKEDGHPCVKYTERWNKEHTDKITAITALATTKWKGSNKGTYNGPKSKPIYVNSGGTPYINGIKYNHRNKTIIKIVIIIAIIIVFIGIVYVTSNNLPGLFGSLNLSNQHSTTLVPINVGPVTILANTNLGNLTFCINRGVFRTSNSRGLNNSQVQELVNYCEFYNYDPGIVNGTNETPICQGVYECQNKEIPIR
ncbi:MAG: hypothetical protein QXL94_01870 [Candidatus Parvarchaeum sp.]